MRGVTSFSEAQSAMSNILRWSAMIFPVIIIAIAFLGYLLIKRALSPIDTMINVAEDINAKTGRIEDFDVDGLQEEHHYALGMEPGPIVEESAQEEKPKTQTEAGPVEQAPKTQTEAGLC